MFDYHIHPDYSIDANKVSIESYCQRALKIGLQEICFTPHFECDHSRRRGHREFHPGTELLSLAVSYGIKHFTVGSDAHKLAELGEAIPEACSLLKRLGQGITVYSKNKPTIINID